MNKLMLPALLALSAACVADEPSLKEGLWSIHGVTTGHPGNKRSQRTWSVCRDHAYDADSRARAKAITAKTCKTNTLTGSGPKYLSESECIQSGSTMHSKGTLTFSGDTFAHTEKTTSFTPAMDGIAEATLIMDEKYVGACPAGMQPGDTMAADGKSLTGGADRCPAVGKY